ncbi:protein kinase family protein [Arcobacter lacus]|uniref:protein kinase family protein n=1 Tax=Arcobacter lacus TaxID=1912876 RepID=UPI0021BAAF86|nr:protein kinase family protein [Arcobacter lacus]MCT7908894.1 protein kinase family protein [Arcobacter lacus]
MKEIIIDMVDKTNLPKYKNFESNGITYFIEHQIAKGHFSTIYNASDIWNNNLAVKIYNYGVNEKIFENEIKQLKKFASPNVIHVYEAFSYEEKHFIIMENFGVAISRVKTKNFDTKIKIFFECAKSLLQTLHKIHTNGYIHGDINPQNILINIQENKLIGIKLCDFSFCRSKNNLDKDYISVANWILPPEYYNLGKDKISSSMDIYHTALVLYSLLSEKELNYTKEEILSNKPQIDVLKSQIPLIRNLALALDINPEKRYNAIQLWKNIIKEIIEK